MVTETVSIFLQPLWMRLFLLNLNGSKGNNQSLIGYMNSPLSYMKVRSIVIQCKNEIMLIIIIIMLLIFLIYFFGLCWNFHQKEETWPTIGLKTELDLVQIHYWLIVLLDWF